MIAKLMEVNQNVYSVQRGWSTQTRTTILLTAEDVEFVMENMVSVLINNQKGPIMVLHVSPCIIQSEIGTYSGTMSAYRRDRMGLAGVKQDQILSDIYESSLGNSPRCRRMTKRKHGEQDP